MTTPVYAKDSAGADLTVELLETPFWVLRALEDEGTKLMLLLEVLNGEVDPQLMSRATRVTLDMVLRHYPATQLKAVKSAPIEKSDEPNAEKPRNRLLQLGFAHIAVPITGPSTSKSLKK